MEMLDIRTPDGKATGVIKNRSEVHRDGDLHGTSHIWLIRKKDNNKFDILLQKGLQQRILMQAVTIYLLQVILLPVRAIWKQL